MANNLRTCATCRGKYSFCPKCQADKNKELWHFTFCSSNCMNIYGVTSKYENGQISASDAKNKLNKLDLSNIENFGTSYKTSIAKINEVTNAVDVAEVKEDVVEESTIVDIVDAVKESIEVSETVEEEKVIKKSRRTKKNVE